MNFTGLGRLASGSVSTDLDSKLRDLTLRAGIPRPRESLLLTEEWAGLMSPNKESLLSPCSGNLNGEDSLVGEVTDLVGDAGPGPGDLKLRFLT